MEVWFAVYLWGRALQLSSNDRPKQQTHIVTIKHAPYKMNKTVYKSISCLWKINCFVLWNSDNVSPFKKLCMILLAVSDNV